MAVRPMSAPLRLPQGPRQLILKRSGFGLAKLCVLTKLCALTKTLDCVDQPPQIDIRRLSPLAEHRNRGGLPSKSSFQAAAGVLDSLQTPLHPVKAVENGLQAQNASVCFARIRQA